MTLGQETPIILVGQTNIAAEEEKKGNGPMSFDNDRKSSGESSVYHVVDGDNS